MGIKGEKNWRPISSSSYSVKFRFITFGFKKVGRSPDAGNPLNGNKAKYFQTLKGNLQKWKYIQEENGAKNKLYRFL